MSATVATENLPKRYLPQEEREELERQGKIKLLYLSESLAAGDAGDRETAWAWMRCVELSATTLRSLKRRTSAQFIRDKGLRTDAADAAYGPDWLDRDEI